MQHKDQQHQCIIYYNKTTVGRTKNKIYNIIQSNITTAIGGYVSSLEDQKGTIKIQRCFVSLYNVNGVSDSTLLVLNRTSLNSDNALLALNWRYILCVCGGGGRGGGKLNIDLFSFLYFILQGWPVQLCKTAFQRHPAVEQIILHRNTKYIICNMVKNKSHWIQRVK